LKIQDGGGGHLENAKKSQYIRSGTTDCYTVLHSDATGTSGHLQLIKFHDVKNPRWRQWPFGKSKNRIISAMDGTISTKFGMVMMCLDSTDLSG